MFRMTLAVATGATILMGGLAFLTTSGGAQQQPAGLAGARPVIEAINYSSIQAALDALPPEGGMVRLPAGVFEISQPLRIKSEDVCLVGTGTATHIKNASVDGQPTLVVAHPEATEDGGSRNKKLWRIRLADFRLTGNPQSGSGIVARAINEIFIDGVTVSEHGGDGILLDHCYEDPRITGSLITYNKATGLNLVGCHDIVVSANQFEENQDALHCVDSFNLCMTGNNIDDHLGHGIVIENTYGSVLAGNMIEECNGTAIVLDRDCYGDTISANVIAHNGGGVELRDAHGCAVSANTFTLMKTDALRIGPASGRIAVSGNSFSNSYIGEGKVRRSVDDLEAGGMTIDGATHVGVAGNVFSSVRPKALAIEGKAARRVLFADNVLTDVESDHESLGESLVADNLADKKNE